MKQTHATTPRTLSEGRFAHGYTTQPVGRRASPRPARLHKALTVVLFALIGVLLAWRG
jgi:hypothetical protein